MPVPEYIRNIRAKIGHDMLYMPGVVGVINNWEGQTLLQQRSDNGLWSLVGGILDPGEEPANCLAREAWEETGMLIRPIKLVGVYSEPDASVRYPSGDEMMFLTVVFACEIVQGEPRVTDEESTAIGWFTADTLPEPIDPRHKRYLLKAFETANHPTTDFTFTWSPE